MSDQMPLYEGTKRLRARPMNRGDYNAYRGWLLPNDEDPADAGYLVEYVDGGKANDSRHAGYISWSPAYVFERTYKALGEREETVEAEIQRKGLTAPRVTPADIEAAIVSAHYFTAAEGAFGARMMVDGTTPAPLAGTAPLGLLTFCVLVLRNGFTVTGESACASPENFDAEVGRRIARTNAVGKVWALEGYRLKQRLFELATNPS